MMTEKEQNIWDLISSAMDSNASPEELKSLEKWLNESPKNRRMLELIERIGYDVEIDQNPVVKNSVFNKTQQKIVKAQIRRMRVFQYVSAASIILLIGICSWIYMAAVNPNRLPVVETVTAYGVKSTINLPDGTTVNLNAGSSLKYPVQFKGKIRSVFLKGEAYFTVAKNTKNPFVVQTGSLNINVLGTRFNVRAFPEEDQVVTTLLEGSVELTNALKNENIRMMPDQQAVYDMQTGKIHIRKVDSEQYISWTGGSYYFDNENLHDITKELERGFNTHIYILSDELKDKVFSGVFDKGESLNQILNIMKRHQSLDFRSEKDSIIIFNYQRPSE